MTFDAYLNSTCSTATLEREILDSLSDVLQSGTNLDRIQIRAARASLQIMIENAIGKSRRILKHYGCPVVPARSRDPFIIMHDVGLISDERYEALMQAVGFRNAMIHDYMNFDEKVLEKILIERRYMELFEFLMEKPDYSEILLKRIVNYSV